MTVALAISLLCSVATPLAASAQPATPTAIATCDIAPRSIAETLALAGSAPTDETVALLLPAGEPADPITVEAIAATLQEMSACLSAGDMLRFYALHSDDWLRRFGGEIEGLATLTTSTPPLADGQPAGYLGPWHVRVLSDGRVLAAVLLRVGDERRPNPSRTRVLVFVNRDGNWLVDETIAQVRLPGCPLPVEVAAAVGPPPGAVFDVFDVRWPSCDEDPGSRME